jgi:hypothetical protein
MKLSDDLREQIYVYHLDAFSRLGYMHKKVYMCVYVCVCVCIQPTICDAYTSHDDNSFQPSTSVFVKIYRLKLSYILVIVDPPISSLFIFYIVVVK